MGRKKRIMSFYQFIVNYGRFNTHHSEVEQLRIALGENIKELAPYNQQLKKIDSLMDLMLSVSILTDPRAIEAVTGSLWCEYCMIAGRPITIED